MGAPGSDLARQLEEDGWELLSRAPLHARRERGERVEVLRAAGEGRARYTVTFPVGEEEFRRSEGGGARCRVVTRTLKETTVVAEAGDLPAAVAAALREGAR